MAETGSAAAPKLARIYGFSYSGRYTPLSRPALFLVHGDGTAVTADAATAGPGAKRFLAALLVLRRGLVRLEVSVSIVVRHVVPFLPICLGPRRR